MRAGASRLRRSLSGPGLVPDAEEGSSVAEENAGHFAPAIDLGDTCGAQPVVHRDLKDGESVAMGAGDEFPPETFLHFAEFGAELMGHFSREEDERTAG